MNFFKYILSEDPDPLIPYEPHGSRPKSPTNPPQKRDENENGGDVDQAQVSPSQHESISNSGMSTEGGSGGGWGFGGLIKTFSTRSESVIETYRRDLMEFGSGLRKETELFREAASRAVKEIPASIETGATVAHGSLETVGHAIDGVLKSTAEIISHGKETLLPSSESESGTPDTSRSLDSIRYNRFAAQLRAIQNDLNTCCEEPEDLADFGKWRERFVLEEKNEEIESLVGESGAMEDIYKRAVPNFVDSDTFWCRYFYRVHKLKHQESVRANLVKRVISIDDEEELSWDLDDDDDDKKEKSHVALEGNASENKESGSKDLSQTVEEESASNVGLQSESSNGDNLVYERVRSEQSSEVMHGESVENPDENPRKKADHSDFGKDSDLSVVAIPESVQEDLGWDEIEDLGNTDEKKVTQIGSPNRADMGKQPSVAEEDDDLDWGIQDDDDDEPVKTSYATD